MRKKILAAAGLIIFVALMSVGTLAYFTAEDRAVNVITLGSVDIEIVEYAQDGAVISDTSTNISDMPEYFSNVEPGMRLIKKVTIQNRGKSTAWVRAKIEDHIYAAGTNKTEELSDAILSYNINELHNNIKENSKEAEALETYPYNTDGVWEEEDGWWHYSEPLEPDEAAIFFDVVTFDGPSMGNRYQGCETNIRVLAQATQYDGNPDRLKELWPAEPEPVNPQTPGTDGNTTTGEPDGSADTETGNENSGTSESSGNEGGNQQ